MLKSSREKTNGTTGETFDGRGAASGGQIDFASLCDARGAGGGRQRTAELFRSGGLPQHAGLHEGAGRGRQNREGHSANHGPRSAGAYQQLASSGRGKFRHDHAAADGDSGGAGIYTKLTGDGSLQKRPMKRVVGPLREMGADIRARDDNFAPLEIKGTRLHAIDYQMPMASAQVKSAVLLAGLFAEGMTSVTEPAGTRDHTELALEEFGAAIERHGRTTKIHGLLGGNGAGKLTAKSLDVPGDLSSAVFFIAAASLLADSSVAIHNVGLNPTRTAILDVFTEMGASIQMLSLRSSHGEVVGDLAIKGAALKGGVIEGERIPLVIDELPMLAALGPYTEEGIEIRNAAELRVKESDRISALAENLRRMGATVEERPDGLKVEGRRAGKLHGAEIEPHGDHRIAMAFAVAALAAEGATVIRDADCAGVSYPTFFEELNRLAER